VQALWEGEGEQGMKSKEQRRQEGEERNQAWRELDTATKINSLRGRRGESKRQLTKLISSSSTNVSAPVMDVVELPPHKHMSERKKKGAKP
jgi:hypothetical protein